MRVLDDSANLKVRSHVDTDELLDVLDSSRADGVDSSDDDAHEHTCAETRAQRALVRKYTAAAALMRCGNNAHSVARAEDSSSAACAAAACAAPLQGLTTGIVPRPRRQRLARRDAGESPSRPPLKSKRDRVAPPPSRCAVASTKPNKRRATTNEVSASESHLACAPGTASATRDARAERGGAQAR